MTDDQSAPTAKLVRFLSTESVMEITGWSKMTLWHEVKAGRFPRASPTSPGRVGWLEGEVAAWQQRIIDQRDNPEWKRKGGRPRKQSPDGEARLKPWEIRRLQGRQ